MKTIEIDFEVWQRLTTQLSDEHDTYNNYLRRLLKLGVQKSGNITEQMPRYWRSRGGSIPISTKLRAQYKGKVYEAEVTERGIKYEDTHYGSLSQAAMAITKVNVNGWTFWEARRPADSEWRSLSSIRPAAIVV